MEDETLPRPERRAADVGPQALEIQVSSTRRHTVVAVAGELDVSSAPQLRRRLVAELDSGAALLIADLSAVNFCASSGFSILLDVRNQALETGARFAITSRHRGVVRPMMLLNLNTVLDLYPTVPDALAALSPGSTGT